MSTENLLTEEVLYSKGKNDECYTPAYAVKPLLKHLEKFKLQKGLKTVTVWCPFDKQESEFVKILSEIEGVKVVFSHLDFRARFL